MRQEEHLSGVAAEKKKKKKFANIGKIKRTHPTGRHTNAMLKILHCVAGIQPTRFNFRFFGTPARPSNAKTHTT
jgi:hypothetical protein